MARLMSDARVLTPSLSVQSFFSSRSIFPMSTAKPNEMFSAAAIIGGRLLELRDRSLDTPLPQPQEVGDLFVGCGALLDRIRESVGDEPGTVAEEVKLRAAAARVAPKDSARQLVLDADPGDVAPHLVQLKPRLRHQLHCLVQLVDGILLDAHFGIEVLAVRSHRIHINIAA